MIRFLISTLIYFGSAAIGITAAALIIPDVHIEASGFIAVVVVYAVLQSVLTPFIAKMAMKNASAFLGGTALVSSFVSLVIAAAIGDSLTISGGAATWIAATVVIWLVTAVASLIVPLLLVKAGVQAARAKQQ